MRDKERLLDTNEPLRFIFSHSALREGWDNPNVLQICTLNETQSVEKKRQEIGRGLRLPVNGTTGERVHDETVNRLTVIANESYEDFARTLQTEFEEDFGIRFGKVEKIASAKLVRRAADGTETEIGQDQSAKIWDVLLANGYLNSTGDILDKFDPKNPHFALKVPDEFSDLAAEITDEINRKVFKNRIVNARDRRELKFRKEVRLSADFQALWDKIKHRTRYRVTFKTDALIDGALARIKQIEPIKAPRVSTTVVEVDITDAGVSADRQIATRVRDTEPVKVLPDILAFLQKETELTRHTLAEILKRSGRLSEFKINPQAFLVAVAREISRALHDLILEGIKYEKVAGAFWEQSRIEQEAEEGIVRYLSNLYEVQNREKSLFDAIVYDSEVEKQFARDLDNSEDVKLFVKLPSWFKIYTPIGQYNPDWAFVTERDEKLYFVRETKSTLDSEERRTKENQKIACGRKHFNILGLDFDVVTSLSEVAIR
jgi:type III restriction enzyme